MSQYQRTQGQASTDSMVELTAELFDDNMLAIDDVVRICCVNEQWLRERIELEVLQPIVRDNRYYFTSATVVRIQQVIHIEKVYDADPQLAALVADLTEEVQTLRREVKRLTED